ncbi:hypothetical protein OG978_37020 [Streptomyces sp. NBC_01591]|uniref:hypothetical protein n=1 Tax=Streptomyces sp. NBC_01591 TaxID=2975888 RepID=UPI002DDC62B0|nr:hypothetical protein [Streptomyces sp. NBC_01591]WSD72517.1 hypothetical protein OG978_37020 [Streptomyces sp. NBC_01591]
MTHRRTLLVALACCAALTGCTSHTPDDGKGMQAVADAVDLKSVDCASAPN